MVDPQDANKAFEIGSWGAVLSTMAAVAAVVFQNAIALLKTYADIKHQERADEVERVLMAKRLRELEARLDEHAES
jgi:hypothetical protein